ncbi:MAG TPA: hypothetical protein VMT00_04705 [Thermoanaerobaculia bacterium]|nr:hypothetical protein [Thermoanaerobaculia bacterium]
MNPDVSTSSLFEVRRRFRRLRMIVDLTANLIENDHSMSHREARSLVTCAEKAILELVPSYGRKYNVCVRPYFERILRDRWPAEESMIQAGELVN